MCGVGSIIVAFKSKITSLDEIEKAMEFEQLWTSIRKVESHGKVKRDDSAKPFHIDRIEILFSSM